MAIYTLATLPLTDRAQQEDLVQTWFADDACAGANLSQIFSRWSVLCKEGPKYGYFMNPPKTWLLVKEKMLTLAKEMFKDSGIQTTTMGCPLLGAPLGCDSFKGSFITMQVNQLVSELRTLATIATTQPHAAYAAFSLGLKSK